MYNFCWPNPEWLFFVVGVCNSGGCLLFINGPVTPKFFSFPMPCLVLGRKLQTSFCFIQLQDSISTINKVINPNVRALYFSWINFYPFYVRARTSACYNKPKQWLQCGYKHEIYCCSPHLLHSLWKSGPFLMLSKWTELPMTRVRWVCIHIAFYQHDLLVKALTIVW